MESEMTPEQQEYQDKYDRELADGIDVVWKRHDDLVAYQRLVHNTISGLDAEESRTEGIVDTSQTIYYGDSTIEQLREDIAFLEAEWERVTKELAVMDRLLRILDRLLGGAPLRPRDALLEGIKKLWWE